MQCTCEAGEHGSQAGPVSNHGRKRGEFRCRGVERFRYPENESRLSDITLNWMLAAASAIPDGIVTDPRVLCVFPDPSGPQHDEYKVGHWQYGARPLPIDRKTGKCISTTHKSVYARFEAGPVVHYDLRKEYRPENMREHEDFKRYYTGGTAPSRPVAVADDIESRWERQQDCG